MEIRNIYQPFELELLKVDEYVAKSHKNTFFEMIFVLEGEGVQLVNGHSLPYKEDKLFMIFPKDSHSFEVTKPTTFLFIRFNDSYLKTQAAEWIQKVEYIFHNHNHMPGCVVKNTMDKPLLRAIILAIVQEQQHQNPHQQALISQLINTIITIAARNITLMDTLATPATTMEQALPLLNYIHEHIYEPGKLRAETLAEHFHVSVNYVSEYFKKHSGESLQQYITQYKIKLIETRLRYTNKRLGEIAFEFGFTDLSHLNRIFKKHKGQSPTAYRQQYVVNE
ncbi:AraC-like protein [Chitinophaga skermanii]|uniref:AraC-like protein n=1 Tax=Chitinophaga skermanii TaxID=331697 RepID=A0A327Q7F3_9BACT|nr:helix-turn-helix domain-containing protein [Chitinophaga skermanii]RAJ00429.1 AraC-like protein [Chitinophaga skermanii]